MKVVRWLLALAAAVITLGLAVGCGTNWQFHPGKLGGDW